jgi:rod shape-determining protein MreD
MKKFVLTLLCILFMIIDNSILPFLAVKTYYPSILFTFVMLYSIINGKWEALWIGVFSGALQDLYFVNAFGINSLVNMLVCVTAAAIGENLFKERALIPVALSFFIGLLKYGLVYLLLFIIGQKSDYRAILYCSLYSLVLAVFMYKKVYKLSQKPFMKREWRF